MAEHFHERTPQEVEEDRLVRELGLTRTEEERERRIARDNRSSFREHLEKLVHERRISRVPDIMRRGQNRSRAPRIGRNPEIDPGRDVEYEHERERQDPCTAALLALRDSHDPEAQELLRKLNGQFRGPQGNMSMCDWLKKSHPNLGLRSPIEMILEKRFSEVTAAFNRTFRRY